MKTSDLACAAKQLAGIFTVWKKSRSSRRLGDRLKTDDLGLFDRHSLTLRAL
jgi:hypothetical protein